jgi:uncharacterized low-complexity protein
MKYMILWFGALVLTLTYTLATGNGVQEKPDDTGKCSNATKVPAKCESGKKNVHKNIPKKTSSRCGQGKCG